MLTEPIGPTGAVFICDHDDGEEATSYAMPADWPQPGDTCPRCGRCVTLPGAVGRCIASRRVRHENEAKRPSVERRAEHRARREAAGWEFNRITPTKAERNASKRARRKRGGR